jgi:hypothetical protein
MHTLSELRSGQLRGIKRLDLSAGLETFPEEIFQLADSLEILNLTGNALKALPSRLPELQRLKVIFCSENQFTELPDVLGKCPNLEMIGFKSNQICKVAAAALPPKLRWLILTDNLIQQLPDEIGRCVHLKKLMLAGNQLSGLPDTIVDCQALELVRIAANQMMAMPQVLLDLPRLAWLAYAGNPFSDAWESTRRVQVLADEVTWEQLTLKEQLGEGASGVIYRASYQHDTSREVAVKLFKGAVTSDGLPRSEMSAAIVAGQHAGLVKLIGEVSGHPQGVSGLVMDLVEASYANLAAPPNLQSCTRDVYPETLHFEFSQLMQIALSMSEVLAHLHDSGIMHGDFYAHNMLWHHANGCLLGDFGAASFLPVDDQDICERLQRIEVRAFGYLLEELLARCDTEARQTNVYAMLQRIQLACVQEVPQQRPTLHALTESLAAVAEAFQEVAPLKQRLKVEER